MPPVNCPTGYRKSFGAKYLAPDIRQTYSRQFNLLSISKKENRLFSGLFWDELYSKTTKLISTDAKTLDENSFTMGDNYPTKKLNAYVGVSYSKRRSVLLFKTQWFNSEFKN